MLKRLDPTDRALLRQTGRACRNAVKRAGNLPARLTNAGMCRRDGMRTAKFVSSVTLLTWARDNGRGLTSRPLLSST